MSKEIENKLIEFIAIHAEVDASSLHADMAVTDTGIDSIGIAELLFDIEEYYNITLESPQELQERFELGTIKELAQKLQQQLSIDMQTV